ncbi:MAG: hypothetical protein P9L94_13800 [Candidatus Hinthialibacter antarcticus]|nr:hypothetical protein [Candidatus Hinthialibacter antarcticus]
MIANHKPMSRRQGIKNLNLGDIRTSGPMINEKHSSTKETSAHARLI